MSSIDAKLKAILPLDDGEIQQMLRYADSLSVQASAEHFAELLGHSEESLNFINQYNARRQANADGTRRRQSPSGKVKRTTGGGTLVSDLLSPELRQPPANMKSMGKRKQQRDVNSLSEIESALRELEVAQVGNKDRKPCNCQATRHDLCLVAPNCLNCGKIICVAEGIGPCTFCHSPVLSRDQQLAIAAELRQARGAEKMAINNNSNSRRKIPSTTLTPAAWRDDDDDLHKAEERKQQLLAYQQTNAQGTKIIDQAADFETPDMGLNKWGSPAERALQLRKQQRILAKMEKKKNRVMSIDLKGRKVTVADESSSSEDESESETHHTNVAASGDSQVHGLGNNPQAREFTRPVYHTNEGIGSKQYDKLNLGTNDRRRLQDERNLGDNDAWMMI